MREEALVIIMAYFRDAHMLLVHWHGAVCLDGKEKSTGSTPVNAGEKSLLHGLSLHRRKTDAHTQAKS